MIRVILLHNCRDSRSPFGNGLRGATVRRGERGGTAWVVGEFPALDEISTTTTTINKRKYQGRMVRWHSVSQSWQHSR